MAAITVVRVIDENHIAGIQIAFEFVEDIFDRKLAAEILDGKPDGNGNGSSGAVPHADRDVMKLRDEIVLRGTDDDVAHLLADALKRVPHGGKSHRVDASGCHATSVRECSS